MEFGWIVHFYQRPSVREMFRSPDEAERYLQYLVKRVPGLQVLHREPVVGWWVSF